MKTIKRLTTYLMLLTMVLLPATQVKAQAYISEQDASDQDEEIYCVIVIEEEPVSPISTYATTKTKTATKTCYYQNSSGTTLWYVQVKGTFSYDGTTSKCTSATVTAESNNSVWKVSNKSSSYSSNKATASATGKRYFMGIVTQTVNRSITLTCAKDGTLS